MKIKTTMYFHNSKEDCDYNFGELCDENGVTPTPEAVKNAMYAGYEVGVEVEWDLETGNCEMIRLKK